MKIVLTVSGMGSLPSARPVFSPYICGRFGRLLGALPCCPDQAVLVSAPPRQTGSQRRTLCQKKTVTACGTVLAVFPGYPYRSG
jgi:hypothetical protein